MPYQSLPRVFTRLVEGGLADASPLLPPPPAPADYQAELTALRTSTDAVDALGDVGLLDWSAAVTDWYSKLGELAAAAYPNAVHSVVQSREELTARVLQSQLPQLGAFFAAIGVIVTDPATGRPRVDGGKLGDFLTDPESLINEAMWAALLEDLGLGDSGHLPAVIAALILLAPQTVITLAQGNLKVAALSPPPARSGGTWAGFRTASRNWFSATVPLPDPTHPDPQPASLLDMTSGLAHDLSATIATRSDRTDTAGGPRTDLEVWIFLAIDRDELIWEFGNGWQLRLAPGISAGFGYVGGSWHGAFRPAFAGSPHVPAASDPVALTFGREPPPGEPDVLIGPPFDTRLEIGNIEAFLRLREASPIIEVGAEIVDFAVVLAPRFWRTFGESSTLWREGIRFDLDFRLAWAEGRGLELNLQAGLETLLVFNRKLGTDWLNLTIHSVRLRLVFDYDLQSGWILRLEARFHLSAQLSQYFLVVASGMGFALVWGGGFRAEFLLPEGLGAQISIGPVTGGGYLERIEEDGEPRYGGALYVKVGDFAVTAFGIYQELESGRKSLIVVIGARFVPGIPVFWGAAITGIGGIVGLHRRVDVDMLRERLVSGAAGSIFSEDPIKEAPVILGDIQAIFPPAEGIYVAGPTFQLSWVHPSLARVDLGIVFEFPGPTKVVLLGSARITLPLKPNDGESQGQLELDQDLIRLRFDFAGTLDLPRSLLTFDASLINSHVMQIWKATGDAGFQLSRGDEPFAILHIGGFHPAFDPEPAVFGELTRVALTMQTGFVGVHVRGEGYFAVTPNTLQAGKAIEAGLKAGPLNAVGFLTLDVLIQFSPFYFDVSFSAGFAIRWNALSFASVKVRGTISGPGPITIEGRFSISILFVIDISWRGSFEIGSDAADSLQAVASALQEMLSELETPANLEGVGVTSASVLEQPLASQTYPDRALVSPVGMLAWKQHRVPLGLPLERFGGVPLAQTETLHVDAAGAATADANDWFSPGSFRDLNKSEALNQPAFDWLQSGIVLDFGPGASGYVSHPINVVIIRLPAPPAPPVPMLVLAPECVLAAVVMRSAPAFVTEVDPLITVDRERWRVIDDDGVVTTSDLMASEAFATAKLDGGTALPTEDLVELGAL